MEKRKILIIKHKQNIPYPEARKIIETQYSKSSNASATRGNLEKEQAKKILEMLKKSIELLLKTYNNIWTGKQFPKSWKQATIIPRKKYFIP